MRTTLAGLCTIFAGAGALAQDPQESGFDLIEPILVNPTETEADYEIRTSRNHFFKRVISSTKVQITNSTEFEQLEGASTVITVPPRRRVLVNVSFDAESRCSDPGGFAQGWCEARILINGSEGAPAASRFPADTFALDSTDGGTEGEGSWEGHAMTRHKCIVNDTDEPLRAPVSLDRKLTNFPAASNASFWLDDWSLVVEMSRGCSVRRVLNGESLGAPEDEGGGEADREGEDG